MKRFAAVLVFLLFAAPVAAEVRSVHVCEAKTLTASTTTDCDYVDISGFEYFSYQIKCASAAGGINVSVDWVGGSAAGSAYVGVPVGVSQLQTNYTTENTWTTLESISPPVSPVGTIRFTENGGSTDTICTAILNMGVAK